MRFQPLVIFAFLVALATALPRGRFFVRPQLFNPSQIALQLAKPAWLMPKRTASGDSISKETKSAYAPAKTTSALPSAPSDWFVRLRLADEEMARKILGVDDGDGVVELR